MIFKGDPFELFLPLLADMALRACITTEARTPSFVLERSHADDSFVVMCSCAV